MESSQAQDWDDWDDSPSQATSEHLGDASCVIRIDAIRTSHYRQQLVAYIQDLADPHILSELQQRLDIMAYDQLAGYYVNKPELFTYTIQHEIDRMKYRVMRDGEVVATHPADVKSLATACRDKLLWRMANQSCFADMLQELQAKLIRPDLDVSVVSKECNFQIDLSTDTVAACSLFKVVIAAGGVYGGQASAAEQIVDLATIEGTVLLCTRTANLRQRVRLRQLKVVFDDVIHSLAETLAYNEASRGGSPIPDRPSLSLHALRDRWTSAVGMVTALGSELGALVEEVSIEDDRGHGYKRSTEQESRECVSEPLSTAGRDDQMIRLYRRDYEAADNVAQARHVDGQLRKEDLCKTSDEIEVASDAEGRARTATSLYSQSKVLGGFLGNLSKSIAGSVGKLTEVEDSNEPPKLYQR